MYSKCINLFKINRIDNWLAQCELSLLLPAYMCSCFNSFIHSFIQYWNQIVIFGLFLVEEKSLSLRMLSSFILICRNQSTVELSEATFVLTQPSGHKRIARSVGSLTQANFTFESHTHTHTMKKKKKNGNDWWESSQPFCSFFFAIAIEHMLRHVVGWFAMTWWRWGVEASDSFLFCLVLTNQTNQPTFNWRLWHQLWHIENTYYQDHWPLGLSIERSLCTH